MMAIINRVPELVAQKFGGAENINLLQIQRDTHLTYQTVSRWVKGRVDHFHGDALEAWCEYLNVQPGDILVYKPGKKG